MLARVTASVLCALALAAAGCGGNQPASPVSPSAAAPSPATAPTAIQPGTIGFDSLTTERQPVSTYEERGFTLRLRDVSWEAGANYGNPRPFVRFTAAGGTTVVGVVEVTGGGQTFSFESVDVYSSTTPIPYRITGSRNGATVFTMEDRVPNTFGQFRRVSAGDSSAVIDTLTIALTNPAAPCCANPTGLDNIVLR